MEYQPSSPVDSPPHSPIFPAKVLMNTIPDACLEEGLPEVDPDLRRCRYGNVMYRTWWAHPQSECWRFHEEQTSLPTNRLEIDPPIIFEYPGDRRKVYRAQLEDHYGRFEANWPRRGTRVAYEPTTFADFRHNDESVEKSADDEDKPADGPPNDQGKTVEKPTSGTRKFRMAIVRKKVKKLDRPEGATDTDTDTGKVDGTDKAPPTPLKDKDIDRPLQGWRSLAMPVIKERAATPAVSAEPVPAAPATQTPATGGPNKSTVTPEKPEEPSSDSM
jgi:hypothetical protein